MEIYQKNGDGTYTFFELLPDELTGETKSVVKERGAIEMYEAQLALAQERIDAIYKNEDGQGKDIATQIIEVKANK